MRTRISTALSSTVTTIALMLAASAYAQTSRDFTATAIQSQPDLPDQIGQIAKSGANMRFEYEQTGTTIIKILRPAEGIVLILDPATSTYLEFAGPPTDQSELDGPTSPCPEITAENQGLLCERSGSDVTVSGIQTERWLLGYPQQPPQVILWDPARKQALRHESPEGGVMQMSFIAMEDIEGRQVEHWSIELTAPGQPTLSGGWWFDQALRVVLREDLPGGGSRRLVDINAGPVDQSLFTAPSGWQKQEAPTAPPAANQ